MLKRGGHIAALVQQPHETDLVPPAPRRHVQRSQPPEQRLDLAGTHEDQDAIGSHRHLVPALLRTGRDIEHDTLGLLPLDDLCANSRLVQAAVAVGQRTKLQTRQRSPGIRVTEHADLFSQLPQPLNQLPRQVPGRGGFVKHREDGCSSRGGNLEEVPPHAGRAGLQPLAAQRGVLEHQFDRLVVRQTQNRRGFQRKHADGQGFAQRAEHHPVLFPAPEHQKQVLLAARVHSHRLQSPPEHEADRRKGLGELVDDLAGGVV